jgi:HSP20 family protein
MALVRWLDEDDFWNRFNRWQREMDRWWGGGRTSGRTPSVYPPINIYDDGESFVARAELPGVDPGDVDVTVTGDTLTLRGKRQIEPAGENCCYHRRERSTGEFRRAFNLPEQVDSSKVVASASNGVLEILLPRAEAAKQRRIEVKTS